MDEPTPPIDLSTPSPYGRAGRNLWSAIAVGGALGAIALASLLLVPWTFSVVVAAGILISTHELESAFATRGITLVRWPLFVGSPAVVLLAYFYGTTGMLAAFGTTLLLCLVFRLLGPTEGFATDIAATGFVLGYLALMGGFVSLSLASGLGAERVITFLLLTVGSDIGGYAAGVLAGRHPISTRISPKKSWEGLAGSLVLQCVVGVLAFVYLLESSWWRGLIAAVVLTITATLGDFVESALKRDLQVKDLGTILPGHGGLMDRMDSLLPNAFVSWGLFRLLLGT